MKHYILMADIIESGKKDSKQLMKDFKELVDEVNSTYVHGVLSPLTITLGDEFQCVLKDLPSSIDIILYLEELKIHRKKNFQLRYVLNQGNIETPINKEVAYGMLGTGLTEAREKLSEYKSTRHRFLISIENKVLQEMLMNAFIILENIIDKWDIEKDYEVVSNFITLKDYKLVSEAVHKTRSQLWKREKTLNIESYNSIKNIIELSIKK
ncbi:SatD family protein [Cytophaga aurantiaca]|uniref:SatD family protein n=1 Tax=Cytophaga aurantiaca TaxID=29530 RepID=UPI00037C562D|nr:SatD family protein [Cytophaga aurantiaca]